MSPGRHVSLPTVADALLDEDTVGANPAFRLSFFITGRTALGPGSGEMHTGM